MRLNGCGKRGQLICLVRRKHLPPFYSQKLRTVCLGLYLYCTLRKQVDVVTINRATRLSNHWCWLSFLRFPPSSKPAYTSMWSNYLRRLLIERKKKLNYSQKSGYLLNGGTFTNDLLRRSFILFFCCCFISFAYINISGAERRSRKTGV